MDYKELWNRYSPIEQYGAIEHLGGFINGYFRHLDNGVIWLYQTNEEHKLQILVISMVDHPFTKLG